MVLARLDRADDDEIGLARLLDGQGRGAQVDALRRDQDRHAVPGADHALFHRLGHVVGGHHDVVGEVDDRRQALDELRARGLGLVLRVVERDRVVDHHDLGVIGHLHHRPHGLRVEVGVADIDVGETVRHPPHDLADRERGGPARRNGADRRRQVGAVEIGPVEIARKPLQPVGLEHEKAARRPDDRPAAAPDGLVQIGTLHPVDPGWSAAAETRERPAEI